MKKEQKYIAELIKLGIYDPSFDSVIHSLVILEREQSQTRKKLREEEKSYNYNTKIDKLYSVILKQAKQILIIQESLGMTPRGLASIKNDFSANNKNLPKTMLELIREKKYRITTET